MVTVSNCIQNHNLDLVQGLGWESVLSFTKQYRMPVTTQWLSSHCSGFISCEGQQSASLRSQVIMITADLWKVKRKVGLLENRPSVIPNLNKCKEIWGVSGSGSLCYILVPRLCKRPETAFASTTCAQAVNSIDMGIHKVRSLGTGSRMKL